VRKKEKTPGSVCQMETRGVLLQALKDLILLRKNQTLRSYRILGLASSQT